MVTTIDITKDFQGYIWMSDEPKPKIYPDDFDKDKGDVNELVLDDTKNPFVIEGQLCDGKKSYSIKFVDGEYKVVPYDITDDDKENAKSYYPNRMKKKLLFHQRWEAKIDTLCADMPVLQPAGFVFVGFDDNKKNE